MVAYLIVVTGLIVGANAGYEAETAADARVDIEGYEFDAAQTEPVDNPIVPDRFEQRERGMHPWVKPYVEGFVEGCVRAMLAVANAVAPLAYANRDWIGVSWAVGALNVLVLGMFVFPALEIRAHLRRRADA